MSQMDGKIKTIEGDTYRVRMMDPLDASDMLVDITKVLAPALGAIGGVAFGDSDGVSKLIDGDSGNGSEPSVDMSTSFERAVVGLVDRIDKRKLREIIAALAEVTYVVKGQNEEPRLAGKIGVHFRGRLRAMYKWMAFALEVQFGDFFEAIRPAIGRAARSTGLAASGSPIT